MAIGAVLISGIRHIVSLRKAGYAGSSAAKRAGAVVAFEAHRENDWPFQES